MIREYYEIEVIQNAKQYRALWYSNDSDGLVSLNGSVLLFRTAEDLQIYCSKNNITAISDNPYTYNFDELLQRIRNSDSQSIDPSLFLNCWNLFSDFAESLSLQELHLNLRGHDDLYNKLFWANNLPSMTPPGENYEPEWNEAEIIEIGRTLTQGIEAFRKKTRIWDPNDSL